MFRRLILIVLTVLLTVPVFARGAEYRKKYREYKRGGWELYGSSMTLKSALKEHCEALSREGVWEVTGTAEGIRSESIARQAAWNSACISYVQQAGAFLRGRIDSDNHAGAGTEAEFSHFYSAYETLLQKEIRGELRPSYTVVRHRPDGTCEMHSFFLVDEEAAARARIRALELAASESEAAQRIAARIREFVMEGFDE